MNRSLCLFILQCASLANFGNASFAGPTDSQKYGPPENYYPSSQTVISVVKVAKEIGGTAEFTRNFGDDAPEWKIDLSRTRANAKDVTRIIAPICSSTVNELSFRKTDVSDEIVDVLEPCKPTQLLRGRIKTMQQLQRILRSLTKNRDTISQFFLRNAWLCELLTSAPY